MRERLRCLVLAPGPWGTSGSGTSPVALPQPPLWFALVIAGLSAVALTIAAIALLLLVILVEAIAPGLVAGCLRA